MSDDDDGYKVGYGKPPKHTQWPKGQSGNPRGRPKGARGLRTDLDRELETRLTIAINGKEIAGTTQQLMLRTLARRAAHGDVAASRVVLDLVLQIFGAGDRGSKHDELSAQDQEIFERLLASVSDLPAREPSDPDDDKKPSGQDDTEAGQ